MGEMKLKAPGEKTGLDVDCSRSSGSVLALTGVTVTSARGSEPKNRGISVGLEVFEIIEVVTEEEDSVTVGLDVVEIVEGVTEEDVSVTVVKRTFLSSTAVREFLSCGPSSPTVFRVWIKSLISKPLSSFASLSKLLRITCGSNWTL